MFWFYKKNLKSRIRSESDFILKTQIQVRSRNWKNEAELRLRSDRNPVLCPYLISDAILVLT